MGGQKTSVVNLTQVAGTHYRNGGNVIQHWDFVLSLKLRYLPAQISRYVFRHAKKNGVEDLTKALHYIDKWMEISVTELLPSTEYVISDRDFKTRMVDALENSGLPLREKTIVESVVLAEDIWDLLRIKCMIMHLRAEKYGYDHAPALESELQRTAEIMPKPENVHAEEVCSEKEVFEYILKEEYLCAAFELVKLQALKPHIKRLTEDMFENGNGLPPKSSNG